MTKQATARRPDEYVARQVLRARKAKGWNQTELVTRLNELGFTTWRQSKVAKLEKGLIKRLTLEEVLALAAALDVQPLHLLVGDGDVEVAPTVKRSGAEFRAWLRGDLPLDPADLDAARAYFVGPLVPTEETESGALSLMRLANDLDGMRQWAAELMRSTTLRYEDWQRARRPKGGKKHG